MNKNFYRIIFNARRGIRMAVAETAASQGKSASGETGATATHRPCWTLTAFASLIALNCLLDSGLQAQVIADRSAPGNQQPTVLQTANGVPQVNIQTPSAAGVSRNVYSQFDVQSKGMILNNSRTETSTQIGGYVQGNPWLANGSARVILNEVNSSAPSQLKGYVEVAGQRAEVIIANPAGIAVNGGGFINASAVTLTTGSVVMNAGNLASYQVRGGTVTFDGAGLDTSTADYTNILARAVAVNAGIWAKDLKVVTGANDINAASVASPVVTSTTAGTGAAPAPSFALDVAALGGMYAGKIYLIGTEAGLGVRNAGTIAASAGNVTLSNNGWISNSGSVYAKSNTSITAQGTVSITGTGLIAAAGNTSVAAQGTGSQVGIASGATVAAGMGTTGAIGSTGNLTIQSSNTTTILGQLASGGDTALSASTLIFDDARVSGKNVQLIATAADISAKRATVSATETLSATTQTRLVTDGATVTAKQLTLAAHDISNVAGRLQQSGTSNTSITLAGRLDNTNGTVAVNSNQLDISVQSLNNTAGIIASNNSLSITIGSDTTQTGSILANKDLTLSTTANLVNSGKIQAGENLNVNANALENTVTGELSSTATKLNATGSFTNRGLVDGGNNAGTGSTRIQAATVNNVGTGLIYGDKVGIATTTLNNDAETVAGITKAATIAARDRLAIGTSTLNNSQGSNILSLGDMAIGGSLDANGQAAGHAGTINNSASTIESFGNMRIAATSINNLNPNLQWESDTGTTGPSGSVYFTQAGTFDTATGGLLSTTGPLTPQYRGGYAYQQVMGYVPEEVCSGGREQVCTPTGNILTVYGYGKGQAQANNTSSSSTFDAFANYTQTDYKPVVSRSTPGRIASGRNMTLDATQTVVNDQSNIVAGGNLVITAPVDNRARNIQSNSLRTGTLFQWENYNFRCGLFNWGWCSTQAYGTSAYNGSIAKTYTLDSAVQRQFIANAVVRGTVDATNPTGAGSGVASVGGTTSLPASSLYTFNSNPAGHQLVETDPRFTNYRTWLSSDYITNKLALDPTVTQKRLGDGFYEQQLVREQVAQLTGRRFLGDFTSDQQQYQALMDSGLTFANAQNLRPGIALSAAQMAALTTDIVWLQQETVTLADGTKTQVLVPHVYAAIKAGDLTPTGALLSGDSVDITANTGDVTNAGTILGRKVVQINANNIHNLAGLIQAQDIGLSAKQDINNTGGTVVASNSLVAIAGRDINVSSTTSSSSGNYQYSQTGLDRVAGLYVKGPGVLYASAGNNINLNAAQIAGNAAVQIHADNNVNIQTHKSSRSDNFNAGNAENHLLTSQSSDIGSQVSAGSNLTISAGNTLSAKAAALSAQDTFTLAAAGNIVLDAGQTQSSYDSAQTSTTSGWLSSTTTTTRESSQSTTAIASSIEGNSVTLTSGQDTTIKGSNVLADKDLTIKATGNITIEAAKNSATSSSYRETRESGLMSGGGMGFSIGTREQSTDQKDTSTSAAASTVGSLAGNVSITAGKTYTQTGSDVLTPAGNIDITAQTVNITEARENSTSQVDTRFKQEGITVSVSNPVLSAAQSLQNMDKVASQTSSDRMKALAAASAGLAAYSAYTAFDNGMGTMINGKKDQIATGTDSAGKQTSRDSTLIDKAGGFNVNVGIGSSSSESTSRNSSDTARGSSVAAGGNVNIKASGAGANSILTIQGANVQAGGDTSLQADNKVNLVAAANTTTQTSTNSNSGASVGMGIGTNGLTVNASMSQGNGRGDGTDTTYINTQVSGKVLKITSGGDTNLQGAVVRGSTVKADVGGNLNIETLQDKSTYAETQSTSGFSVSVPIGPGKASGSINVSNTDIKGNYQSANQQSGIQSGDGGFQVSVAGNTDLKGGVIASTDKAIADNKNSLTTSTLTASEVKNQASASVTTTGFNVGTNMFTEGTYGLTKGIGANILDNASQNSSRSGQTKSAVSAGSITITDEAKQQQTTGNTGSQTIAIFNRNTTNANSIAQRQDIEAIKRSVEAERAIKNEAVRQITTLTDEAYRVMFKEVPKFYKVSCPAGVDCTKNPEKATSTLVKGSAQEVQAELAKAPAGAVLAVNGIDNPLDRAGQLAMQNAEPVRDSSGNEAKPTTIYLMHYVPSNNGLSELLVAGYEKKLAHTLGYSTQDQAYADGLKTLGANTGGDVVSLGHSRGTIVQTNANAILASEGVTKPNLSVQGVGGAVSADEYTKAAEKVVGQKNIDNVTFSYFNNDPIPVGAAGNPGVLSLSEFWKVLTTANSAHSCYGTGASGCQQVQILSPNAPDKAVQDNSNLIQYKGGIPYDGNGNLIVIKK